MPGAPPASSFETGPVRSGFMLLHFLSIYPGMSRRSASLSALLLGANGRQRMRVSQSLLAMPALLLIQALLILEWRHGQIDGGPVAWFSTLTLAGCAVFYVLVRCGLGERLSREASLVGHAIFKSDRSGGWS